MENCPTATGDPLSIPLMQSISHELMAANEFGSGRSVYISGLPYSHQNSRILHRAILWSAHSEDQLKLWFSSNCHAEVHAFPESGKFCVVNNTYEPQTTTVYTDNSSFDLILEPGALRWYSI